MTRAFRIVLPFSIAACLAVAACGDSPAGVTPVARIELSPDTAYVPVSTTRQLTASAYSANQRALSGIRYAWASSDTAVATVSEGGVVTGRAYGTATVTATADGVSTGVTVWVTGTPGTHVRSGGGVTDTIGALLPDLLVVEVRDSLGRPLIGRRAQISGSSVMGYPGLLVGMPGSSQFGPYVDLTTDAQGTLTVRLRFGTAAGIANARLYLAHEPTTTQHLASYNVLPGAPAQLRLAPQDTSVFAGRSVALRTEIKDRGGNPATGTMAYTVSRGPAAVDAQGRVSTTAYGTAWVVGRVNGAADSVRVAATPEGAFAAHRYSSVLAANFDGTGRRVLASGVRPSWSPAGDRIVYQSDELDAALHTSTLAGPGAALPGTPPSGWHQWAQYSPDGQWIYFCTVAPGEPRKLWRIRPDGAGLQLLLSRGGPGVCYPSASPDGMRIVFSEEVVTDFYIRVRNLATGEESAILARGNAPSWSPTGELIAFTEMGPANQNPRPVGIQVMRPDGSERRRVGDPSAGYGYSPRWSPDGRWLIAATGGRRVHLIEVATGLVIELPRYDEFWNPSWKPGGPLP